MMVTWTKEVVVELRQVVTVPCILKAEARTSVIGLAISSTVKLPYLQAARAAA